ncbi:class I SAM-dependent methyltransferase [Synechococcus sp. CCY9202]|uniref:class I SAM-dependent methyltransferase n=1 Tax=Synechococcus sp. CCY9202 TaxID=174698 RepID=UPI002B20558C|nr:class I SAM-dependent methyltransferase [Synechococcus sp. CCY9202]MEA5423340.1 class I SAM-dependent methyltransferase [Synechococcus sp. CCY9202]
MRVATEDRRPDLTSRLVGQALAVKPLWALAKGQARRMMIQRAERLGIPWRETVAELSQQDWQPLWQSIQRDDLAYPANYTASFHGYDAGHLCWEAAYEFEVASNAVHSSLYPEAGPASDRALREGYHAVLLSQLPQPPARILDLHATVGLSSFALEQAFPAAEVTGLDFSPHYLSLAAYNAARRGSKVTRWIHALPEATGLAERSADLVSAFLLFHEMPQGATRRIFREVRRLLGPGGSFALMDMNPASGAYKTMPAFVMTLLKSTEPYMDAYFALDLEQELREAGFDEVVSSVCSPRHRAMIARVAG